MWEIFIGLVIFTATWGYLKVASFIQDVEDVQSDYDALQSTAVQVLKVLLTLMGLMTILMGFIAIPHVINLSISVQQNASNFNQTSLTIINDLTESYELAGWYIFITFTMVNFILLIAVILFVYTNIGSKLFFGKGKQPGIRGLNKRFK